MDELAQSLCPLESCPSLNINPCQPTSLVRTLLHPITTSAHQASCPHFASVRILYDNNCVYERNNITVYVKAICNKNMYMCHRCEISRLYSSQFSNFSSLIARIASQSVPIPRNPIFCSFLRCCRSWSRWHKT